MKPLTTGLKIMLGSVVLLILFSSFPILLNVPSLIAAANYMEALAVGLILYGAVDFVWEKLTKK